MTDGSGLQSLWRSAPAADEVFDPTSLDDVPRAGARYLLRALAGRDLQPRAVRLRMHGQIDLGSWRR